MIYEILLLMQIVSLHGASGEKFGKNNYCGDDFCQNFGARHEVEGVGARRSSADGQQSLQSQFSVPDGSWWLHQHNDVKHGFLIGEEDCYLSKIHINAYVDSPGLRSNIIGNYYDKIDREISDNAILQNLPITEAIRKVIKYHKSPNREDFWEIKFGYAPGIGDGDIWSLYGDYEIRYGYIYGYVSCQYAYLSKSPRYSISYIEHFVSFHYGLVDIYATDDNDVVINNGTSRDKIDDLIDKLY